MPRGRGERTAFHTLFVVVSHNGVPSELHREQARNLISLRMRAAGSDAPVHLGVITL